MVPGDEMPVNGIDTLLRLPKAGKCDRFHRQAHMKSKTIDSGRLVTNLSCNMWSCRACSARKRQRSGRHVAAKLLTADGVIFESVSNPDEWTAQKKRLNRLRASWVRYGPLHVPGVILGVAPSQFGNPFCDREGAIIRLGEVIRDMRLAWKDEGARCRPINYSRDWTPPDEDTKYEMLEWVRVKEPHALVAAFNELGICARARVGDDGATVSYAIPPDWTADQVKEIIDRVSDKRP